jgi:DNA-binding beta-propeller fold protein YncE
MIEPRSRNLTAALTVFVVGLARASVTPEVVVDFSQPSQKNPYGGIPFSNPEGIVREHRTTQFFVTGFLNGVVYKVKSDGKVSFFAELPVSADSRMFGLAQDPVTHDLYVAVADETEISKSEDEGPFITGIWKIGPGGGSWEDAENPHAPRKFFPHTEAVRTLLEYPDGVALDHDRNVFVSDPHTGRVFRASRTSTPQAPAEEVWAESPHFAPGFFQLGVNDLVLDPNRDRLFAVTSDQGKILAIDTTAPETVRLLAALPPTEFPDGVAIDAAGTRLYVSYPLSPVAPDLTGHTIRVLNVDEACFDDEPPVASMDDPRLAVLSDHELLGVVTDLALGKNERDVYAVDLDFFGISQGRVGKILRLENRVDLPPCGP